MHPDSEFYLRQLSSDVGFNVMAVRAELKNLISAGLVTLRPSGNRRYFKVNSDHLLFPELKTLIVKTVGVRDVLINYLMPHAQNIDCAFIYGSMASGTSTSESDIDLFIIGDISPRGLSSIFREVSDEIGREVNYYIMNREEYSRRMKDKDHFIDAVGEGPKIYIIGDEEDLGKLAVQRLVA